MGKRFNVTGTCFPCEHYMVNTDDKLEKIKEMIDRGDYFCINRGRQYGKTTTFSLLKEKLKDEYTVFSISFESMDEVSCATTESFLSTFLWMLNDKIEWGEVNGLNDKAIAELLPYRTIGAKRVTPQEFTSIINRFVKLNDRPVVLFIDEVDQAGNYASFIKFLGIIRDLYLNRALRPTFRSVVLAGVYDIRNLKLKLRPEENHQYNSPWNIAVNFDIDMSLSEAGIAGMLQEYANDTNKPVEIAEVAKQIREYTSGYPFLVSRLCQLIDENSFSWNKKGVLEAVKLLLKEKNTLFDDMAKKLQQFPALKSMLHGILYNGQKYNYNSYDFNMNIADMFGYLKEQDGFAVVPNRIFETWLYNLFTAEDGAREIIFNEGSLDKSQFIKDGVLDMEHILERFAVHFNSIYNAEDGSFVERMGRKLFLLYLRPIINGVGNYYIEAETRDATRTDIVVDYLGKQYVVELKIWRGNAYNERGEKQLAEYLEYFGLEKGYMLSFCFNKDKKIGLRKVQIEGKILMEAVV